MDNTYFLPLSYNFVEILTSYVLKFACALCYPGPAKKTSLVGDAAFPVDKL